MYANYVIFLMGSQFLQVFVVFGLTSGMMRIMWDDRKVILSNSLFIVFIFSSILFCLTIISKNLLINVLINKYYFINDVLLFLPIRVFVSSIVAIIGTYFIAIEKPVKNTIVSIIASFIFMLILIAIKYRYSEIDLQSDILWLIIVAQTISTFIASIYSLFASRGYIIISLISIKKSISILKQTSIFLSKHIIGIFQTQASQIVLAVFSNTTVFGIYSYYNTIIIQLSLLIGAFFKTYTPKIVNILQSKIKGRYKNVHRLVKKSLLYYIILSPLFLLFTYFAIKIILIYQDQFSGLINREYIIELRLFYFMLVAWVVGNFRSFIDIWQYENKKYVNHFIIFIQIIALFILYFGAIYFLNEFGVIGIVMNQFLLYITVIIINLYCYRKFIFKG
jgi:O-antigen/teichoic acid export membrane protein